LGGEEIIKIKVMALTQQEIIERFKKVHGNIYDYSETICINTFTKVKIICREYGHDAFFQTPDGHFAGKGCPKCRYIKSANTKRYWTKEKCDKEILKYNSVSAFKRSSPGAYKAMWKNGWSMLHNNFVKFRRTSITKEKCAEAANKYKHRSHFQKNDSSLYTSAIKNGWLDEICTHMIPLGNTYKRANYVFEFSDKFFYNGLSCDIERRKKEHLTSGPVFKHITETGLYPVFKQLTDYLPIKNAQDQEEHQQNEYKKLGWTSLNVAKTGGLGGNGKKWVVEAIILEALLYNNRKDFYTLSSGAYGAAKVLGILNEVCKHMKSLYSSKHKKCIIRLSLQGKFPKEYESITIAEKALNISNISLCCQGKRPTAGGFKWMYKSDYEKLLKTNKNKQS